MKSRVIIAREVLLVEIERRCREAGCNQRTRVGLTKEEASAYCGFECERCGQFWDDALSERDVPEWWEELTVTGLRALRESPGGAEAAGEASEVVSRLSEEYRRTRRADDVGE